MYLVVRLMIRPHPFDHSILTLTRGLRMRDLHIHTSLYYSLHLVDLVEDASVPVV